jgi:hypothetical protein
MSTIKISARNVDVGNSGRFARQGHIQLRSMSSVANAQLILLVDPTALKTMKM